MDNNSNKVLSDMLMDWIQDSLDLDPRYDDGDDEVYEAAKEEYVSRYSSEAEAIKNLEDWLLWKHTRRS